MYRHTPSKLSPVIPRDVNVIKLVSLTPLSKKQIPLEIAYNLQGIAQVLNELHAAGPLL